jgi:hypothetical protein
MCTSLNEISGSPGTISFIVSTGTRTHEALHGEIIDANSTPEAANV